MASTRQTATSSIGIVYSTQYGQTLQIVNYIQSKLTKKGYNTDLYNVNSLPLSFNPSNFSAMIIGTPVYYAAYNPQIVNFIKSNKTAMSSISVTAFFTVSGSKGYPDSLPDKTEQQKKNIDDVYKKYYETEWASQFHPTIVDHFAGAVHFRMYNFFLRHFMKQVILKPWDRVGMFPDGVKRDYEFTDWTKVDEFVENVVEKMEKSKGEMREE